MLKIIDNILPINYANKIENQLLSPYFNWNFNLNTADPNFIFQNKHIVDTPQFTYKFYDSDMFNPIHDSKMDFLNPMQYIFEETLGIDFVHVVRVKANLLLPKPGFKENNFNIPHIDLVSEKGLKSYSVLYYVNESDGDTVLFNQSANDKCFLLTEKQRVKPKKNRAVIFDSDRYHASSNPITTDYRCVINFIFEALQAN